MDNTLNDLANNLYEKRWRSDSPGSLLLYMIFERAKARARPETRPWCELFAGASFVYGAASVGQTVTGKRRRKRRA